MTSELPPPCPECAPYGGIGRLVEQNGNEAIGPCPCERGKTLRLMRNAARNVPPTAEPVVSVETVLQAVEILGALLQYFPTTDMGRAAVASELRALCIDDEALVWLTDQLPRLYSKWPGAREMRIVYCSRYRPLSGPDLHSAISEAYPDGIPAESPSEQPKQLAAGQMLALPPGNIVSASPSIERAVRDLAEAKDLNRLGPAPRVGDIPVVRLTEENSITQANIERAVKELHAKRVTQADVDRAVEERRQKQFLEQAQATEVGHA